jgi:hypothetical protein
VQRAAGTECINDPKEHYMMSSLGLEGEREMFTVRFQIFE